MRRRLVSLVFLAALLLLSVAPVSAQTILGNAVLRDTVTTGDTLEVGLAGVVAAPGGSHYEGWLSSADGSQRTSLGSIQVGGDGVVVFKYVSPRSENLIGANSVFELSVEPDGDADPNPSGTVAYRGQMPDLVLPAVRELLFRWPSSRFGTPSAAGLIEDAKLLDATSSQLLEAANAGDVDGTKRFAERLVNTVEGQLGESYGDHNGDGVVEGPGDGTGALNFAWGTYWRAKVAAANAPGDDWIGSHSDAVVGSVEQQIVVRFAELRDLGLQMQDASDPADVQQRAQALRHAASNALNGADANGNGNVDVAAHEGGAIQVVDQAQQMAAIRVGPAS